MEEDTSSSVGGARKRAASPSVPTEEVIQLREALARAAAHLQVNYDQFLMDPECPVFKRSRSQEKGTPATAPVVDDADMAPEGTQTGPSPAATAPTLDAAEEAESERIRLERVEEEDSLNPLHADYE